MSRDRCFESADGEYELSMKTKDISWCWNVIPYISYYAKECVERFFVLMCALFLFFMGKGAKRIVIYYHGVKNEDTNQFKTQMKYLCNQCNVVSPSKIKAAPVKEGKTLVAITFDDAFVNVLKNAVPVLKKHNLTAGICVPTGNLGQPPRWKILPECSDTFETVMSREQVVELSKDGFEILSHTKSHPVLTEIDFAQLNLELSESKKTCEETVGHEIHGISYPYGAHNAEVCDLARTAGYQYGFTIEPETVNGKTNDMQIGRFLVSPRDSLLTFKLKVNGAYEVTKHLRSLKKYLLTRLCL